jgi:hypothetical protein
MGDGCRALALSSAAAQESPRRAARLLAYAERWAHARGSHREVALNTLCRARLARLRGDDAQALALAAAAAGAFDAMHMAWHAGTARALIGDLRPPVQGGGGGDAGAGASAAEMAASATAASAS